MHTCKNCGTEFDTKFCPNCGTPAPAENCPYCGEPVSPENKFCPSCGRALGAAQTSVAPKKAMPVRAAAPKKAASPALVKFCSFLPYVVSALFALFSALLFLMCLGQVSTVMGMGTGSIYDYLSMGSASSGDGFDIFGGMMGSDMGATYNVCAALVSFGAIGAVLAGVGLIFRCNVPLRVKRLGNVRICTISEACMFAIYFVDFLLTCILCGSVGDEITAPGAGPVCVLVFSLLFALCSAGAKAVQKFLPRISPSAAAEIAKRKAKRRASMGMPVPPEGPKERPQKPMYRGADCSDALRAKIVKYAKAKKILVILAGIMFVLIGMECVPWWISDMDYLIKIPSRELGILLGISVYLPACGAALTAILGGIFGSVYYKKKVPDFAWQRKSVWSNKWMFLTILAFCGALLISNLVVIIIFVNTSSNIYLTVSMGGIMPVILIYCIVVLSCAGAIAHKGTKLSLAVYGADRPWEAPNVQDKYQNDMRDYRLQKKLYRAQRRAEKVYLRKLAYYEEGAKYHA